MKKNMVLGVLFFGSVWGVSEVFLGESLYAAGVRYPSVPLNVIGLVVLAAARTYLPQRGCSLAIGCCAALYKFLAMTFGLAGTPVYPCHLLGIFCLGLAYETVFASLRMSRRSAQAAARARPAFSALCAAASAYAGYALFAFSITYLFRYEPWAAGGLAKVGKYIAISGTLAAAGGAIFVPLGMRLAEAVKRTAAGASAFGSRLAAGGIALATAGLWLVGILVPV
ncbi:MAG: hypothetical protein ACYTF6_11885 [Planctomycetota bacterium]|jgi:hypothetical protein